MQHPKNTRSFIASSKKRLIASFSFFSVRMPGIQKIKVLKNSFISYA